MSTDSLIIMQKIDQLNETIVDLSNNLDDAIQRQNRAIAHVVELTKKREFTCSAELKELRYSMEQLNTVISGIAENIIQEA